MSKRCSNWTEKDCSLLLSAISKRERQCLGRTTGPGYEGADKCTQATKRAAWDEVAAEIARSVKFAIATSLCFRFPLYYCQCKLPQHEIKF